MNHGLYQKYAELGTFQEFLVQQHEMAEELENSKTGLSKRESLRVEKSVEKKLTDMMRKIKHAKLIVESIRPTEGGRGSKKTLSLKLAPKDIAGPHVILPKVVLRANSIKAIQAGDSVVLKFSRLRLLPSSATRPATGVFFVKLQPAGSRLSHNATTLTDANGTSAGIIVTTSNGPGGIVQSYKTADGGEAYVEEFCIQAVSPKLTKTE